MLSTEVFFGRRQLRSPSFRPRTRSINVLIMTMFLSSICHQIYYPADVRPSHPSLCNWYVQCAFGLTAGLKVGLANGRLRLAMPVVLFIDLWISHRSESEHANVANTIPDTELPTQKISI